MAKNKTYEINSFETLGKVVTKENIDMLSGNLYGILMQFISIKEKHPEVSLKGVTWTDNGKMEIRQPKLFKIIIEDPNIKGKSTLSDIVYGYRTKYRVGFTAEEITNLLTEHYPKITYAMFADKMGVVTCQREDGKFVYYHSDVELAIRLCLEKRGPTQFEFD